MIEQQLVNKLLTKKYPTDAKMPLLKYLAFSLAIIPLSVLFYEELGALPQGIRLLIVACTTAIFGLAGYLIRMHLSRLGVVKVTLVALAAVLGVLLSSSVATHFPSADHATISYSDGSQAKDVKPGRIDIWGRSVDGYILHPPYASVRVPHSLTGEFSSTPKNVIILFSKPKPALLQPDGTPTVSDGISAEVNVFDPAGRLQESHKYSISQDDFLKNHRVEKEIKVPSGISKVEITVGSGPPGSTPLYDSTIAAFEIRSISAYLHRAGKILLVGFSFLCLALLGVFSWPNNLFPRRISPSVFVRSALPYISLLIPLILAAYWSSSKTSLVYFWDYRNYWQKTEALYELVVSGAWKQALDVISNLYAADYSMLPAVLPTIISLFTGYPTRINYLLIIIMIYAVPAYIMVAYLAKRLLDDCSTPQLGSIQNAWVYSSLPVFLGIPLYFTVTLYLMPDIGGVVLYTAALLYASSLTKAIVSQPDNYDSWKTSELLRSGLGLGIFISLMFLFRRWYIFAAAGIACSCIMLILIEMYTKRKYFRNICLRIAVAFVYIAFPVLTLLSWVLFDWSNNAGQHDYSSLYASYKGTMVQNLKSFSSVFGLFTIALGVVFLIVIAVRRLKPDRYLFFILVTSSLIASLLFVQVQSAGIHHYYLLMPLLGVSLSALSVIIFRHYGFAAVVAFSLVIMLGNGTATWKSTGSNWIGVLFPKYIEWLPKQQPYKKGYDEIARWLLLPENEKKKFCVIASGDTINQDIFSELWQVIPNVRKSFRDRVIPLSQVDSRDGPPPDTIKQCEISLVGVPFQSHLRADEQYTVKIVLEDLIDGTGIGSAYGQPPKVFLMDEHTRILAYERVRMVTDDEYSSLAKRFLHVKGPGYVTPRK